MIADPDRLPSNPTAIDTVCLIDASPSMREPDYPPSRFAAALDAATALIAQKARHRPRDRVAIALFSGSSWIAVSLRPVGALAGALPKLEPSGYGTDIHAALRTAAVHLDIATQPPRAHLFRRPDPPHQRPTPGHLVLLSDGEHNRDSQPAQLADVIKAQNCLIECVGIGDRAAVNEALLKRIASNGPDGRPRYRFIGDRATLIDDFRVKAMLQVL